VTLPVLPTGPDLKAAYDAYVAQIDREDRLYQSRMNFDLIINGALLALYAAALGASFSHAGAKTAFLLLVCANGFAMSYLFERLLDRGYRQCQTLKSAFFDEGLADWAKAQKLPQPFLDPRSYRDYPLSEITMYLFSLWVLLAIISIAVLQAGVTIGQANG
jgi:hypothetical protein